MELLTNLYKFSRRGKTTKENKTFTASVFGKRIADVSTLTYEHLKSGLTLASVKKALDTFNLDLCLCAIIGADVLLIQNASGGGLLNIVRARLMNDGYGNRLDEKQRTAGINKMIQTIIGAIDAMGLTLEQSYVMVTTNAKAELKPDLDKMSKPEPVAEVTTEATADDNHADLDDELSTELETVAS